MKKIVLLVLLFKLAFGCATCMIMVPTVEVNMQMYMKEKKLNKIHMEWNFSDIYTDEMINQYDKNRNDKLDKEELDYISEAMLDYIKPKGMLTFISYADEKSKKFIDINPSYENFTLKIVKDFLVFSYDTKFKDDILVNSALSVEFEDYESYYAFIVTELNIHGDNFIYKKELELFTATISLQNNPIVGKTPKYQLSNEQKIEKKPIAEIAKNEDNFQENLLKKSMKKIKSLFESIKDEKNPMSYIYLLFFAYLYGVIHALGPGHGKTLVASYFLSNERSYTKALFISLAIGVVHTFSAFILTLVIYYVVNTLLAQFLDDTIFYTTKISALIIISIAIYLIYKKYRLYKKIKQESKTQHFTFSTSAPHISTCGCGSCKIDKDSTDIALVISAGIIPCPGTTTLFIFAISTGLYYAGFISAFVMSLGMSSIIFFSALFSTVIRKKVLGSNDKLKKYLEFMSLAFILVLGTVLLFA